MFRPFPPTAAEANATSSTPQEEYTRDKPLILNNFPGLTSLIRHTSTGTVYLAKTSLKEDFPDLVKIRTPGKPESAIIAFEAAARVLNHENLVSLVGALPNPPSTEPGSKSQDSPDFSLVYERCADGNLKQLFENPPCELVSGYSFLPEGLVWHVCLSILRALMFLHEGVRERVVLDLEAGEVDEWKYNPDDEGLWMPILHREIRPENIHFQSKRGKESYGMCKLGGFGRCLVSGTARVPAEDWKGERNAEVVGCLNILAGREAKGQEEMREIWYEKMENDRNGWCSSDWDDTKKYGRVYLVGSEIAELAGILYRMMTGEWIQVDLCKCGCFHIDPSTPCRCFCPFKDVHTHPDRLKTKYSDGLRDVVLVMLRQNRENSAQAYTWYVRAMGLYQEWKASPDGRGHVDHYDDLKTRKMAELKREEEEIKCRMGEDEFEAWKAVREKEVDLIPRTPR
ncbi:hypothetical protein GE09DRAFT_1191626 [Coniochaeta sp. 2T2.1]|nr:hypothetical protein GE09DRAFT_1191626 [Coniochaeta sp. 2T2.1]